MAHIQRRQKATRVLPRPRCSARSPGGRVAVALLIASALSLAACSSGGGATSPAAPKASGATTIVIRNFAFSPATTTVTPGATVTVDNEDQVTHTLTSSKGDFTTGDIPPGHSKTFTAPTTAGSYPYICSIHQYMSGILKVS